MLADGKDFDRAIAAFVRASTIAPEDAEAYFGVGYAYRLKQQCEQAVPQLKKAIELRPDYYEAQRELAYCYHATGATDQAIKQYVVATSYRAGTKEASEYAANNLALAALYRKKGDEIGGAEGEEYKKTGKACEDDARKEEPDLKRAVKKLGSAGVLRFVEENAPPEIRKVKAIWEPINYKGDVKFTDVLFVNEKVGWVTGSVGHSKGAVILHTRDGGDNWTIQLGDLQSSEMAFTQLRDINETRVFAAQPAVSGEDNLLRTTDGENWEVCGTLPEHRGDYTFISPTVGIVSYGKEIRRTQDAGRAWKQVFACEAQVDVQGLMRNVECGINSFHFPSNRVGYAIGFSTEARGVFVAKTEDSGVSWKVWAVLPGESGREGEVFFTWLRVRR